MSTSGKYDLQITDTSNTTKGYVFHFSADAQGPGVSSQPIDVPTVTTTSPTQAGGPYDVAAAGDYKRLALQSSHSGCAQESYDTEDASPSKFWESMNIDVSEKGILKLGPGTTAYTTSPTTIQGVTGVGLGKVWQAFDPAGSDPRNQLRYSTDNVTWTSITYTGTDPTGNVVALCCDGAYEYAAFSGNNGIWKGTVADAWTEYCSDANGGDDAMALAACGGYIYVAKGDGTNVFEAGYINASGVYTALSPAAVNNLVTAVAAVTVGQFVYVVSTGGGVSRVYAMQKDPAGSDDTFQQVAQFPTGFIAKCAFGYLGTLYVGGVYDSYTTSAGIGAIYLVSGTDMSLLTMVGDDETEDWRVLFLHGYEKHLYFVANNSIWKWSLEHGGYSHVSSVAGGTTPGAAAETWDLTEAMTAEPSTGWSAATTGGALTIASAGGETSWGQTIQTATIYCDGIDGHISSYDTVMADPVNSYPDARSGSNLAADTSSGVLTIGQNYNPSSPGTYTCWEGFLIFDTSSIPVSATITSATLSLYVNSDTTATEFTLVTQARDWGGSLSTADWVAGASIPSNASDKANFNTSQLSVGAYNSASINVDAITAGATTQLFLFSEKHRSGIPPTSQEYVSVQSGNGANPPKLVISYIDEGTKTYTASSHAPALATGATMEITFGTDAADVTNDGTVYPFTNYFYDGTYLSRCRIKQVKSGSTLSTYFGLLDSGSAWTYSGAYSEAEVNSRALRMTTKNGVQNLFLGGGNVLSSIQAPADATAAAFKFQMGDGSNSNTWNLDLDTLKYTNDGAYDPTVGVTTSSGNLAACQDTLWVSATDVGIYKTNTSENTTGWLTTSRSSSHMQTVSKFYRAIEVTTDQVLSGDQTIKAEWAIDGVWGGGTTLTATTSTTTKHTWVVNTSGQDIRFKITLGRTSSLGPRITGRAVKYLLPHFKKHTWMLNCTENVLMKNGQRWDEDASAAIDFLFTNADEYTVAATEYDSSIPGQIESVDFVDLQRRSKTNNNYQGIMKVVYRELG